MLARIILAINFMNLKAEGIIQMWNGMFLIEFKFTVNFLAVTILAQNPIFYQHWNGKRGWKVVEDFHRLMMKLHWIEQNNRFGLKLTYFLFTFIFRLNSNKIYRPNNDRHTSKAKAEVQETWINKSNFLATKKTTLNPLQAVKDRRNELFYRLFLLDKFLLFSWQIRVFIVFALD